MRQIDERQPSCPAPTHRIARCGRAFPGCERSYTRAAAGCCPGGRRPSGRLRSATVRPMRRSRISGRPKSWPCTKELRSPPGPICWARRRCVSQWTASGASATTSSSSGWAQRERPTRLSSRHPNRPHACAGLQISSDVYNHRRLHPALDRQPPDMVCRAGTTSMYPCPEIQKAAWKSPDPVQGSGITSGGNLPNCPSIPRATAHPEHVQTDHLLAPRAMW